MKTDNTVSEWEVMAGNFSMLVMALSAALLITMAVCAP